MDVGNVHLPVVTVWLSILDLLLALSDPYFHVIVKVIPIPIGIFLGPSTLGILIAVENCRCGTRLGSRHLECLLAYHHHFIPA
jgi:hypothetical protein